MKKQPIFILFITTVSLLLILALQAYLVYDYYATVRESLTRESDAIMAEIFRTDLNRRENLFYIMTKKDTDNYAPLSEKTDSTSFVIIEVENEENKGGFLDQLHLGMHQYVSKIAPIDKNVLDSITSSILQERNIRSDFSINHIKHSDDNSIGLQKKSGRKSFFSLSSELLYLDFDKTEALQLTLINPFGLIAKRMALMLFLSLTLCGICVAAFLYLMRVLAKQKQLEIGRAHV